LQNFAGSAPVKGQEWCTGLSAPREPAAV